MQRIFSFDPYVTWLVRLRRSIFGGHKQVLSLHHFIQVCILLLFIVRNQKVANNLWCFVLFSQALFDEFDVLILIFSRLVLGSVFLPSFPPPQWNCIHCVSVLSLIRSKNLSDFLSLSYRRWHKHKGIKEVIDVQVSLSPLLKSEKINSHRYHMIWTVLMTVIVRCHNLQMMFYPHFVGLLARTFAELAKAKNWSLQEHL